MRAMANLPELLGLESARDTEPTSMACPIVRMQWI